MRSLALLLLVPLASLASAQGAVHVVGDGGAYPEIQPAVDAAAEGDVVLVKSGAYAAFTLAGKGVSVIADTDAEVIVDGEIVVEHVPAGSLAVLRGLTTGETFRHGVLIQECEGAVRVEECELEGQKGALSYEEQAFNGARVVGSAQVLLSRCTLSGGDGWWLGPFAEPTDGGAGVHASISSVAVVDCTLHGGWGAWGLEDEWWNGGLGGDGVLVWKSTVWVGGTTVHGGNGGYAFSDYDPWFGIKTCGDGGDGGNGVRVLPYDFPVGSETAGSTVVVRDLVTFPGFGGGSECGGQGEDGQPVKVLQPDLHDVTLLPGDARGAWASSPARAGTNARVYVRGKPDDLAIAAFGPPAPFLALPGQPLPLATAPAVVLALGAVPAGGVLQHAIPVPSLGSGIDGLTLGLQAVVIPPSGAWQIAPFGSITLLGAGL